MVGKIFVGLMAFIGMVSVIVMIYVVSNTNIAEHQMVVEEQSSMDRIYTELSGRCLNEALSDGLKKEERTFIYVGCMAHGYEMLAEYQIRNLSGVPEDTHKEGYQVYKPVDKYYEF